MSPDLGNSLFEAVGAFMAWRNFVQLRRDGQVRGVYWPIYWFYSAWGLWNLYYYPALGQWGSTAAGAVLVAGNLAWVFEALSLHHRSRKCDPADACSTHGRCWTHSEWEEEAGLNG